MVQIAREGSYSDFRLSFRCFCSDFKPVIGAGWYVHLSAMRRSWQRPHVGVTWSQLSFDFRHGSHDGRCAERQLLESDDLDYALLCRYAEGSACVLLPI